VKQQQNLLVMEKPHRKLQHAASFDSMTAGLIWRATRNTESTTSLKV